MSNLRIGVLARVKPLVWAEWCLRHQKEVKEFKPQPVIALPSHPPYDECVMLAFPFYWWREDEIELVE